jgi:hypothetical protein
MCPDLQALIHLTRPSLQEALHGACHPAISAVDGFVRNIQDVMRDTDSSNRDVPVATDVEHLSGSIDSRGPWLSSLAAILPSSLVGMPVDHNTVDPRCGDWEQKPFCSEYIDGLFPWLPSMGKP